MRIQFEIIPSNFMRIDLRNMVLLTCCGSRTGTTSGTCGRSRTYISIYFNYDQIFQDFFFSLVDVELVVDVVPIDKKCALDQYL